MMQRQALQWQEDCECRQETRNEIALHEMKGENVRDYGGCYGKDLIKYDNSSDTHYTLREV